MTLGSSLERRPVPAHLPPVASVHPGTRYDKQNQSSIIMSTLDLRSIQSPLKLSYREKPEAALVTLRAQGRISAGVSCKIETGKARFRPDCIRPQAETGKVPARATCCWKLWSLARV